VAVAQDASSPAVVRSASKSTATTITTVSFTPPAQSLLLVSIAVANNVAWTTAPTGFTVSTSVGGITFTNAAFRADTTTKLLYSGLYYAYLPTAPGAMTLTVTRPDALAGDLMLAVRVLTGAAPTPGAVVNPVTNFPPNAPVSTAITPTQVGSLLYVHASTDDNGTLTAVSGTTSADNWADASNLSVLAFGSAGPTVSTSAVTVGYTLTTSNTDHDSIVQAVEIIASVTIPAMRRKHVAVMRAANF
jgi:hypothetical protein